MNRHSTKFSGFNARQTMVGDEGGDYFASDAVERVEAFLYVLINSAITIIGRFFYYICPGHFINVAQQH